MQRTIEQYRNCKPESMAQMSQAAIYYAFEDMKNDILNLHYALSTMTQVFRVRDGEPSADMEVEIRAMEMAKTTLKETSL